MPGQKDTGQKVSDMENRDSREFKGYLITETDKEGKKRILYADDRACEMTGLSVQILLMSDPVKVTGSLETESVALNDDHELWVLNRAGSRRQKMAELERMNEALEDALKAAEAANEAKSSFLSNMSHDIRTPMNAIMGMTSIAISHIDEKVRVQDCLKKIQSASSHLMGLVNDVLDMSRIESGRMTLNEEVFSLADLVHDISVITSPQASRKKQDFSIEIGQILRENLIGDVLHLRQILVNIIGNAVKYTGENGKICVCFTQLEKDPFEERESGPDTVWLDFSCEDNGIGMSPEFLERIFDPFEREGNTTASRIEGTGLGIAIVKSLLERMGGRVQVTSREGEGSRFTVQIPFSVAPVHESMALPVGETVLASGLPDEVAVQCGAWLKEEGMKPVFLKTGLETVTWLTEAQYENRMPCALLLGQEFAEMPVLELAAHVSQLAGRDFPVLLVSGEDWAQKEYRAKRAGVSAFVPCPLFKSRLLGILGEMTVKKRERSHEDVRKSRDYSRYHVMLVEDNELNQEIATELLSLTGVQVETAGDGARAVELFEASPEGHFDLIFMDIQMPVMDGYEAAKRIRAMQREDAGRVWIVAMTANAFVEDIRRSREAGMNEHFSKPVDPERLNEILYRRLN